MEDFRPGLYRHYKGKLYRALFLATHHENEQQFVVYVPLEYPESGVRVRELEDWFAYVGIVPRDKLPARRFERIGP
jgi:hypothetical protein